MNARNRRKQKPAPWVAGFFYFLLCAASAGAAGGILQMRDGYFWDPVANDYFIPHGIAYQTWNPPIGANQTFEQIDYDLTEFKKMHANSVRVELVWGELEVADDVYDWSKADHLVAKAEELGLKLFVLIGYQYPPSWFPQVWRGVNDQGLPSDVINYELPAARQVYADHIQRVTGRYKDSPAVAGWILGNEYAYFDLWEPILPHRLLGYDPVSQANFRASLVPLYGGVIAALNAKWGSAYGSFNEISMPPSYPADRHNPGYHDLIQWRKKSIADFMALGAVAARAADTNHLISYAMVGGIFNGDDANQTCEDARIIVARCRELGVPLDFWSINNYAWATLGTEMRSADFGIAKLQHESGLPVLVTETGHSSTETLFPGAAPRQPKALPSQMWEALASGAIGVHLFHWNDRQQFGGYFLRESGFGIVQQNRLVKSQVHANVSETLRRMEQLKIGRLLGGSSNPPPDVQFLWSTEADMGWPRANQENAMLWGAFKRLGHQPGILTGEQFEAGAYTNGRALILSRCFQMNPAHLDRIATNVMAAGVHVHANADLPGQFDAYHQPNPAWVTRIGGIFGLNVSQAVPGYDLGATYIDYVGTVNFTGVASLGAFSPAYSDHLGSWKVWHGVLPGDGQTIVTHTGNNGTQGAMPALQVKNHGTAKTAINTFALGDTYGGVPAPPAVHHWDIRTDWLRTIYRDWFGLTPVIDLTGSGSRYVAPDYRICRNGSILISLLNEHTNSAAVTVHAPSLLAGRVVENLTAGGLVATNADGTLTLNLGGDDFVLLYAYQRQSGGDASLVNTNANKLWFRSAPTAVWPVESNYLVSVGFETIEPGLSLFASFERVGVTNKIFGVSTGAVVIGAGNRTLQVPVPDANLADAGYVSTRDGAAYVLHAWLQKNGQRVSEVFLPVRLLWGVRPVAPPTALTRGQSYGVTVAWQELPSFDPAQAATPLSRADIWEPVRAQDEFYNVVLELRQGGSVVASDQFLTSTGSDQHIFSITVPTNGGTGPFTWHAYLDTALGASADVNDSFEAQVQGEDPALTSPWQSYVYAENGTARWLAQGIHGLASDGAQSAFIAVTNPPTAGSYSGFGLHYVYGQTWALPLEPAAWSNYTFSCDLREAAGRACQLELQLKDARGGRIQFVKTYVPGPGGWDTVAASVNQFTPGADLGFFDPATVRELVINIRMSQPGAAYNVSFDRIRFNGPERRTVASPVQVRDSFENRPTGSGLGLISPWVSYVYAQNNNVNWLAEGIHGQASQGGQSAFMVVNVPANPGAFAGFGMYYIYSNHWALPASQLQWSNYVFSFDFKEFNAYPCVLEMQIKSGVNAWIEFVKPYTPGHGSWDTVRASLDQFTQPPGVGTFNPNDVQSLAVNIRTARSNAVFSASFDNLLFRAPEIPNPARTRFAIYTSANDPLAVWLDRDGDGVPDLSETGTGLYLSDTDTGTNPDLWDSDGDGQSDGAELVAGTNPNLAGDFLRLSLQRNGLGEMVLGWAARTNRLYSIYHCTDPVTPAAGFQLHATLVNLTTPTNGWMQRVDTPPPGSPARFYLLRVQRP